VEKYVKFPQYRLLKGRKVFYKIYSENEFVEISWIGEKCIKTKISSMQYPTWLRIQDMLACNDPFDVLPEDRESLF